LVHLPDIIKEFRDVLRDFTHSSSRDILRLELSLESGVELSEALLNSLLQVRESVVFFEGCEGLGKLLAILCLLDPFEVNTLKIVIYLFITGVCETFHCRHLIY
jgi:hypothetical protein